MYNNFREWLQENYGYLILLSLFLLAVIFYFQKIYKGEIQLKILLKKQKLLAKKIKLKEKNLEEVINKLNVDNEKLEIAKKKLYSEERMIKIFAEQLFRKEELFTQQLLLSSQKERKLHDEIERIKIMRGEIIDNLGKVIPMSSQEAEKKLLSLLREEAEQDLDKYKEERFKKTQREIEQKTTEIICLALEKSSSKLDFSKFTSTIKLENRQLTSKIIGKEGRNINAFRKVTGTEINIDRDSDDLTIEISSFNSFRREVALKTLQSLIKEERFSPAQIESVFNRVSEEIDDLIVKSGEEIIKKLELFGIHPELIRLLGKLRFRTSYGQNVLNHSYEVAELSGNIASELGLDRKIASRAGLFHDIGKVIEEGGNSHVLNGIELAKKYKESEIVINAIASHHRDYPATNFYSLIVKAADKISAARPGARGYQLEAYVERMNNLENIAKDFPGIKKSYAFQAGREVWVIADAEKLNDYQTWEVSRKIKEKIKEKIIIPGEVTIHIIREKRFIQKLNDSESKDFFHLKIGEKKSRFKPKKIKNVPEQINKKPN